MKPQYDAAHVILGGEWRMPTYQEFQELVDNCIWTLNASKGGYTVKGKNGNSIIMPFTGCVIDYSLSFTDSRGYYWSSTLNRYNVGYPSYLYFYSEGTYFNDTSHCNGYSIRPVTE